jgi:hypothetical protein
MTPDQTAERIAKDAARRFMDDGSPSGPDKWRTVSIAEVEEFAADLLLAQQAECVSLQEHISELRKELLARGGTMEISAGPRTASQPEAIRTGSGS